MLSKSKRRLVVFISIGITILLIGALALWVFLIPHSKQSDYPELSHPSLVLTIDTTLEEQMQATDLAINATVVEVKAEETKQYIPEKGSAEEKIQQKNGTDFTFRMLPIELKINEVLAGDFSSDTITIYISPFAIDCIPEFKPGDQAVFLLTDYGDTYGPTTLQDSFFYIAKDNKVYPANYTEALKKTSGIRLSDLKTMIQEASASVSQ